MGRCPRTLFSLFFSTLAIVVRFVPMAHWKIPNFVMRVMMDDLTDFVFLEPTPSRTVEVTARYLPLW